MHFKMSSAICFNLDLSKILLAGNGLMVKQQIFFGRSKLKVFADDKINVNEKLKLGLGRLESIVGKGENAGYQHFLLFLQCFQKRFVSGSSKVGIVWQRIKIPLYNSNICLQAIFLVSVFIIPPQTKFFFGGGGYWSHPVSLYVCLSVTKSCPWHTLKSITAGNFKLYTQIGHIVEKCSVQEP